MKKFKNYSVFILIVLLVVSGCSKSDNNELYIFNTKSEIGDALTNLAKDYEEETGIKVKTFSPGSGADSSETMNTEMSSKNAPAIFSTNGLKTWGPDEGDFMFDMATTENEQLKELIDYVPQNMRLSSGESTSFGIPYNIEGYGYIVDVEVLEDLFPSSNIVELYEDLVEVDYEGFSSFVEAVDQFIYNKQGTEVVINGTNYKFASEKTELTASLTGVFVEAGAETWTYSNHLINIPMNTVFNSYSDAFYSEPEDANKLKEPLMKYIEVLEFNTRFTAGGEGRLERGPEYINTTVGSYDNSIQLFAEHKGLFLKQGNWIYPNLNKVNPEMLDSLVMVPIKMPFTDSEILVEGLTAETFNQTIPVFVPNYWVINKKVSEEKQKIAEDFLVWLHTSERGMKFLQEESGFIMYNETEVEENEKNSLNNAIRYFNGRGTTLSNPFDASPGNFLNWVGEELKESYLTKEIWDKVDYDDFTDRIIQKWIELKDMK